MATRVSKRGSSVLFPVGESRNCLQCALSHLHHRVIGRDGRAVNITMKPRDMVFYESHSLVHGVSFDCVLVLRPVVASDCTDSQP